MVTYRQKSASLWRFMNAKKTESMSNTAVYNAMKGHKHRLGKSDFFKAIKPMREAQKFIFELENYTDMPEQNITRIGKDAYEAARHATARGKRDFISRLPADEQEDFKLRGLFSTVEDIRSRVFLYHPDPTPESFLEWY